MALAFNIFNRMTRIQFKFRCKKALHVTPPCYCQMTNIKIPIHRSIRRIAACYFWCLHSKSTRICINYFIEMWGRSTYSTVLKGGKYIFLIAAVVVVIVWEVYVERSKFILCTLFIHTTWSEMEYKRQEISWRKERNVDFIHKWCQKSLKIQKKTFSCRLRGKEIWNKTFNQLNNNNNVHWIKRLLRKWMKESWMNKNSVI